MAWRSDSEQTHGKHLLAHGIQTCRFCGFRGGAQPVLTLMHLLSIRPCARNALTFALLEPAAAILYRTPQTTRFPGPKRPG
jgi:hypothetical protein